MSKLLTVQSAPSAIRTIEETVGDSGRVKVNEPPEVFAII
jgi:hypothetical protein